MHWCEHCCLITTVGSANLSKIQEAVPEHNNHHDDFVELTESLTSKYPDLISTWEHTVQEWEYDPTKPNPFEVKSNGEFHSSARKSA